jgi:hypothetical protein
VCDWIAPVVALRVSGVVREFDVPCDLLGPIVHRSVGSKRVLLVGGDDDRRGGTRGSRNPDSGDGG